METRDLFERLVGDEPPLTISAASAAAAGHRVARRRLATISGVTAVVVVVALIGALQVVPAQRHRGTLGGDGGLPVIPSLAFASAAQIAAASAAVDARLTAAVAGPAVLTNGEPQSTAVSTSQVRYVETIERFLAGTATAFLRVSVSTPIESKKRYGASVAEATTCPQRSADFLGRPLVCTNATPIAGGHLFAVEALQDVDDLTGGPVSSGAAARVMDRATLFVAPDGSTLSADESAWASANDGTDVALPPQAPDAAAVTALAENAAVAWHGAWPPSLPTLPFVSLDQVNEAASQVLGDVKASLGLSKAAAAGETDQVTPARTLADPGQARVRYPVNRGQATVLVSVFGPQQAAATYPWTADSESPCAASSPSPALPIYVSGCTRTALPGGAVVWDFVEQHAALPSDVRHTDARQAVLVAADGSALRISYTLEGPDHDYVDLAPSAPGPSLVELGDLAEQAAYTWASGQQTPAIVVVSAGGSAASASAVASTTTASTRAP